MPLANHHDTEWYQKQKKAAAKRLRYAAATPDREAQKAETAKAAIEGACSKKQRGRDTALAEALAAQLAATANLREQLAEAKRAQKLAEQEAEAELYRMNMQSVVMESRKRQATSPGSTATQLLYEAFEVGTDGLPRLTASAGERAGQRAVKGINDSIDAAGNPLAPSSFIIIIII